MSSPRPRALEAARAILTPETAAPTPRQEPDGSPRRAATQDNQPELEAFFALAQLLPPAPVPASLTAARVRAAERMGDRPPPGDGTNSADESPPGDGTVSADETPPGHGAAAAHGTSAGIRSEARPWVWATAGAAVTAVLLIAAALLLLPAGTFEAEGVVYLRGTGAARQARGVALRSGEELMIYAEGLSRLERGYRYVAWNRVGEAATRLGSLVELGEGRARLRVRAREIPVQLEITIERSTGTGGPEGPAVLAGLASPRS